MARPDTGGQRHALMVAFQEGLWFSQWMVQR